VDAVHLPDPHVPASVAAVSHRGWHPSGPAGSPERGKPPGL